MVTRTVHFGIPTREERRAYTTVLRSLAALALLSMPSALPAAHADPVARGPLWNAKQDYMRPTGYGVGAALNRKEGRYAANLMAIKIILMFLYNCRFDSSTPIFVAYKFRLDSKPVNGDSEKHDFPIPTSTYLFLR